MTETATETPVRRGRPRPEETITRDEAAFGKIQEAGGQVTRNQLRELLGGDAAGIKLSQAYLSLVRLRQAGRVERVREGTEHVWKVKDGAAQG